MVERYFNALIFLDVFPSHGPTSGTVAPTEYPFLDLVLIIQIQVIGIARRIAILVVIHNGQLGSRSPTDRCLLALADFIVIAGIPSQLQRKQQPVLFIDKAAVDSVMTAVFVGYKITETGIRPDILHFPR